MSGREEEHYCRCTFRSLSAFVSFSVKKRELISVFSGKSAAFVFINFVYVVRIPNACYERRRLHYFDICQSEYYNH